ncbi:hypothetical protein SK128_015931 [Halocaridina rubra]|uniref:Uncharacterized protein n=1 Tax=Halocaridina rubra TaxID=373956 RepID=A0AAN8WU98_HALRR
MPLLTSDRDGARTLDLTPQSRRRYRLSHGDYCPWLLMAINRAMYLERIRIGACGKSVVELASQDTMSLTNVDMILPWNIRKGIQPHFPTFNLSVAAPSRMGTYFDTLNGGDQQ